MSEFCFGNWDSATLGPPHFFLFRAPVAWSGMALSVPCKLLCQVPITLSLILVLPCRRWLTAAVAGTPQQPILWLLNWSYSYCWWICCLIQLQHHPKSLFRGWCWNQPLGTWEIDMRDYQPRCLECFLWSLWTPPAVCTCWQTSGQVLIHVLIWSLLTACSDFTTLSCMGVDEPDLTSNHATLSVLLAPFFPSPTFLPSF